MKILNSKELIAYATAFVSFVLPKIEADEIILFGSVARKEATEKSDIDLFFNIKKDGKKIKKALKQEISKFHKTKIYDVFQQKGSVLPINIEVGNLDKWKLKRSIMSSGIVLYGRYKSIPEITKQFTYFSIKPIKDIAKRNKLIRKLFGRKEKAYLTESLVSSLNGKKLTPLSFIIPQEKSHNIINLLQSEKADFSFSVIILIFKYVLLLC